LDMVYKASFIERAADIYRDYEQRRIDRSQLGIAVRSLAREYQ
jgi:cation transport regulator ChaB